MSAGIEGRVAIISGAAGGIGRAIADGLHAAGARLALLDVDAEGLENAEAELRAAGATVETFVVDLADPDQVVGVPAAVSERLGRVGILVNNAGVRDVIPFAEYGLEQWRKTLEVNLTAPFLLARGVVPDMRAAGWGRIVNISSVAAELAFGNRSAYNVSKAAVGMLTKSIALELAAEGICCNAVAPGIIETPLNRHYLREEALSKTIFDNTPARRWGRPEEIAGPVVFLCGDEASYINGATILVDGGWSCGKGY
jgi:NAD(P)-dependent dehydrogenase (short-subunit alcohol dehydrogenase family)